MQFLIKAIASTVGVVVGLISGLVPFALLAFFPSKLANANPWMLLGCTIALVALPILGFVGGSKLGIAIHRRY